MRGWTAVAVAFAGCYSPGPDRACAISCETGECPSDLTCQAGVCVDPITLGCSREDGGIDAPETCAGTDDPPFLKLCAPATSTKVIGNPGATAFIDTASDDMCTAVITSPALLGEACVRYGDDLTIAGPLRPHGSRPLILFARGTLTIDGPIDAAGHATTEHPAGSPGPIGSACAVMAAGSNGGGGGGGGAGGGLGAIGGGGGKGQSGTGNGASPVLLDPRTFFRAGCDGSAGGELVGTSAHRPGFGGGAVYLAAGTAIVFGASASINASGGGAAAVVAHVGGDGGGSGGMIILDAPAISGTAGIAVFALGGGGSSGGTTVGGAPGKDPQSATQPGVGGVSSGAGSGGSGGGGATTTGEIGGSGTSNAAGGGGGGGGIGIIRVRTTSPIDTGGFNPQPR